MALKNCVTLAINAGKMTRAQGDALIRTAERFAQQEVDSAQKAIDTAFTESALRRRQVAQQAIGDIRAMVDQANHPLGKRTGAFSILAEDITGMATNENVAQMGLAIRDGFMTRIADAVDAMRTKAFGLTQDTKVAQNVLKELTGEASGDAVAAGFAKSIRGVFDDIRKAFNKAGGHILDRKNWFPIHHDGLAVGRAAKILNSNLDDESAWVEFIRPKLRLDFITDDMGRPLTGQDLDDTLRGVYRSIVNDGSSAIDALAQGQLKLANRHRESRFLVFKDADSLMAYNRAFGNDDVFLAITDYITNMSNEIALMRRLGPNPESAYKKLRAIAEADMRQRGQAEATIHDLDALFDVVTGKVNQIGSHKWANRMAGVRNFLASVRLGRAMISATADVMITRHTARLESLEMSRIMREYLHLLNPANNADRRTAAALTGIMDGWTTRALGANRFAEITGKGWTAIWADMTMRLTALTQHTNAMQTAVAHETFHQLAMRANKSFDEVNKLMSVRRFFSPEEWDLLRANAVDGDFMTIEAIRGSNLSNEMKHTLERKLLTMGRDFASRAVPVPTARSQAILTRGHMRGTWEGEMMRGAAHFKGFPVSVIMLHMFRRQMNAALKGRAYYMTELMLGMTVMGAFALQLKEISKGRDPLPMADENAARFWFRAFVQGGGAGIFGDFLMAGAQGKNRFGSSLGLTVLGPAWQMGEDIKDLTWGNIAAATGISDEKVNLGADVARVFQNYTPFLSSAWYANLLWQRMFVEQLVQGHLDPKAREKWRRNERRIMRDQNQEYWWEPGEMTPERAPEIL